MLDTLLIPLRVHIFLESKSKKELKIDDGKVSRLMPKNVFRFHI
jgi:hypothetical protein